MLKIIFTIILLSVVSATFASAATLSSLNPVDYGVTFNGTTDDTDAWQRVINAAQSQGLSIVAPCGNSIISGQLNVTEPLTIAGGGMSCTQITEIGSGQVALNVTSAGAVQFHDFTVACTGTGDYAIAVAPTPPATNVGSRFRDLSVFHCAGGFDLANAYWWVADAVNCNLPASRFCFLITNTEGPDLGDSTIANSTIQGNPSSPVSGSYGILQFASGGLIVSNSHIIGWDYGYLLSFTGGTSELTLSNNKFGDSNTCIGFSSQTGSPMYGVVVIGNMCNIATTAMSGAANVTNLVKVGNNF